MNKSPEGKITGSEMMEMTEARVRILKLLNEKVEVDNKITKLWLFISSDTFGSLAGNGADLLLRQYEIMNSYSLVLLERIKFDEDKIKNCSICDGELFRIADKAQHVWIYGCNTDNCINKLT